MSHFRLFREKSKWFFFQKNPSIFGTVCPFWGKTECSSKFCSYLYFLKKFRPSIIVSKFEGKVMSGFQATLFSEAYMHTFFISYKHFMLHIILTSCFIQTLHASYQSDFMLHTNTWSSIVIEVIRTVFIIIFFMKKFLSI